MLRVVTLARRPYGTGAKEIGAPADLTVERKARERERESVRYDSSSYDCSRNEGRPPLSPALSPLLSSTYYLSSPNSRRSPSARSSSFSLDSLFFPVVPFSPPLRSRTRWKCHRHRRARFPSLFFFFFRRRRVFPRNRSAVHQFRRDVVARSLEENYRVRG